MRIRVVDNEAEFCDLKQDWDRLAQHSTIKFDWIHRWWKYFGKNSDLTILVAEKKGKIIGIAPLCINYSRVLKFFPFRKLSFLGGEISDYLDFLADPAEDKKRLFSAFFNHMFNQIAYDALELRQVNSLNSDINLWKKYIFLNDLDIITAKTNTGLDLAKFKSYKDYSSTLSRKLKADIKQRFRMLEKNDIKAEFVFKNEITEDDIEVITKLDIERQKFLYDKGNHKRDSYFAGPVSGKFLKEYLCEVKPESKLLGYVKLNDVIVAYALSLVNDKTIYYWSIAFATDYSCFCPSKLMLNELIKYAFDNGFQYIDFMRGEERYKFRWVNTKSVNYNIVKDVSLKARLVSLYRKNSPEFIFKLLRPSEIKIS